MPKTSPPAGELKSRIRAQPSSWILGSARSSSDDALNDNAARGPLTHLPQRLLRPKAVMQALGISRPTLHRRMTMDPTFPRAIRLGTNSIAFVEAELLDWLNARRSR